MERIQQPNTGATHGLTKKLTSAEQLIAAGLKANTEGRVKEAMQYFDQAHYLQVSWLKGMTVNLSAEPLTGTSPRNTTNNSVLRHSMDENNDSPNVRTASSSKGELTRSSSISNSWRTPPSGKENSPIEGSDSNVAVAVVTRGAGARVLGVRRSRSGTSPTLVAATPEATLGRRPYTPTSAESLFSSSSSSLMAVTTANDSLADGEDDLFLDSVRRLDDMRMRFVKSLAHLRTPPARSRRRTREGAAAVPAPTIAVQPPAVPGATPLLLPAAALPPPPLPPHHATTNLDEEVLSPGWAPFPTTPEEKTPTEQDKSAGSHVPSTKSSPKAASGNINGPLSKVSPSGSSPAGSDDGSNKSTSKQSSSSSSPSSSASGSPAPSAEDDENDEDEDKDRAGVLLTSASPAPKTIREKSLRKRLKEKELLCQMLTKQLESHGDSAITEVVSLEKAQKKLRQALEIMMSGEDNDGQAEKSFEKWDKFIQNHPEHIAEQKRILAKWDEDNAATNSDNLRIMRTFVPPDIWSSNQGQLTEAGLLPAMAKRIWSKKVLWLIRAEKSYIARMHAADLNLTYSIQGLDLVELRAVWACLPETFENDGDARKAGWKEKVLTRLKEMVTKDEGGGLTKVQVRAKCYDADLTTTGPFDPDAALIPVASMQGNAFTQGVDVDELQKLCSTQGSLASRRSSLVVSGAFATDGGGTGGDGSSGIDSNEGPTNTNVDGEVVAPPRRAITKVRRPAIFLGSRGGDSDSKGGMMAELTARLKRRSQGGPGEAKEETRPSSSSSPPKKMDMMAELTARLKRRSQGGPGEAKEETRPSSSSSPPKKMAQNPLFAELAGRFQSRQGPKSAEKPTGTSTETSASPKLPATAADVLAAASTPSAAPEASHKEEEEGEGSKEETSLFSPQLTSRTTPARVFGRLPRGHKSPSAFLSPAAQAALSPNTPSPGRDSQRANDLLTALRAKRHSPQTVEKFQSPRTSPKHAGGGEGGGGGGGRANASMNATSPLSRAVFRPSPSASPPSRISQEESGSPTSDDIW